MSKTAVLMIAFAVSGLLNCISAPPKQIVAVVHEFPNYVFHLFTLGGVVPDPEYVKAYSSTLPEPDRLYLEANRKELAWADGGTGSLTPAFLFLPGYINPLTQAEVDEYFELLNQAVRTNDPAPVTEKYKDQIERTKALVPFDFSSYVHSLAERRETVSRISEIFRTNYAAYDRDIWPTERKKIEAVASKLNPELRARDFIRRWEELTGIAFKSDAYEIVLYTANSRGSNANSLAYDRNTFYYAKDPQWMLQFLSHEAGTHILIDVMNQAVSTRKYPFPVAYKAYETMCEFYNRRFILAGEKPLYDMKNYDDAKFLSIYGKIFEENPRIKPSELLMRGIETYTAVEKPQH
jgi:hypothetical protein